MKQKLEFPRLLFSPSAYCIRQLNLLFILVFSYFCFYDNPLLPPQFPWTRKESPWLMDSEVLVDSDVWAPEVRLNITQDYPGWLLQVLGSRSGDSFRVLASKISYVKIQGVPAIQDTDTTSDKKSIPFLIPGIWFSSSWTTWGKWTNPYVQGPDVGDPAGNSSTVRCFSDLSALIKFVLEVFLIFLFQHLTM